MNTKKAHRYLTIVMTLLFAVSVFTVTAFATDAPPPGDSITTGDTSSASQASEGTSSLPETPSNDTGSSSALDDGTGGNVTPSPEGQQPTDNNKSGVSSTDSTTESSVSSEEETTSAIEPKPKVDTRPVDTQARRVEAIASQAEMATSDPDVLSSQDWSELFTSVNSSQSEDSSAVDTTSSDSGFFQSTENGGGISWLLIAGIILIVLSLCGIAFFIYEQFFKDDDDDLFSNSRDISSHSSKKPAHKDSEPTEFIDISSNSDGHVGESGLESISKPATKTPKANPQAPAKPAMPKASADSITPDAPIVSDEPAVPVTPAVQEDAAPQPEVKEPVAPAVQETSSETKAPAPEPQQTDHPKAQATPVTESNFDWGKFFNEDSEK